MDIKSFFSEPLNPSDVTPLVIQATSELTEALKGISKPNIESDIREFYNGFDTDIQNEIVDICLNPVKGNPFFRNLMSDYGISYEDVMTHFVYAGGNPPPSDSSDQVRHYNYHKMAFPKAPSINDVDHCVCSHPIVNNCFIYDTRKQQHERNAYINVGNCCIKRFMKHSGRTCVLCKEPHHNRKNNLCNNCRTLGYDICEECGEPNVCKNLCEGCIKQRCKSCKNAYKEKGHYCYSCSKKHCGTCDTPYKLDEREHWRKECKRCWWKRKNLEKCEVL